MKPPRNQRISSSKQRQQQHVLDVKVRVGMVRERRFRAVAGFICKAVLYVSLAGGAWLGGKEALRVWVWENPEYFVREPRVTTDGTLTREQVLTAADLLQERNIFTIDLGRVRAAVGKLPQVESAEVQRTLPNRIAINITERRPIAWVILRKEEDPTTSERSFLIDARSIVMRSRVLLPHYYHLPIISGVETENLVAGQRVSNFGVRAALELVRLNADSTRFQVRNIDISKGYCLVVTDQRRARITFGFSDLDGQLARLNQLLDAIEPTRREIRTINLIPVRNVPVTFYDPAVDPPEEEPPTPMPAAPRPEPAVSKPRVAPPASGRTPARKGVTTAAKARPKAPAKAPAKKPAPQVVKARKAATAPVKTPPPVKATSPVDHLKKPFNLNG